jgi:hypothetical protein
MVCVFHEILLILSIIPLSKTKETNVLFASFRKMRYAESYESWARFLDKSAFLLGHGARTTPSSSLDGSKITPALVSFDSLSGMRR